MDDRSANPNVMAPLMKILADGGYDGPSTDLGWADCGHLNLGGGRTDDIPGYGPSKGEAEQAALANATARGDALAQHDLFWRRCPSDCPKEVFRDKWVSVPWITQEGTRQARGCLGGFLARPVYEAKARCFYGSLKICSE